MSNWKTHYPLKPKPGSAESIITAVAHEYGLELCDVRGLGLTGRRAGSGGIVFAARVEAARRCIAACIRPGLFAKVLAIGDRRARRYYRWFWESGRGPECTRRAAS